MKELAIQGLLCLLGIPLAYLVTKLIFKKSIIVWLGFVMLCYAIFTGFLSFWEGILGINSAIWILPVILTVGFILMIFMERKLKRPLLKSIQQVKMVSEGNLNIKVEYTESTNELDILNNSIFNLAESLKRTIENIALNAETLASASQQVNSFSEQLSERANDQASSIEEVSSTMEEISSNIQQTTENAQETERESKEANESVHLVFEKSQKAVEANRDIASKISIINEIALQTNILALNAAVEAARAGEYGRGFAVVAAEVRKLAEKSRFAADEIIKLSVYALQIAEEAGEIMNATRPKIENTSRLIQEISAASMEQDTGAHQINDAMQQLNVITQHNASSSEELAGNSEELARQADMLKQVISFFKIKGAGKK